LIDSLTNARLAARAALEKHAEGVVVMDLRAISDVTDFFVVCTADSTRQIDAVKDHIEVTLRQRGCPVWHAEEGCATPAEPARSGNHGLHWVLLDCGAIVVHLFDPNARSFYRLEELWRDAPRIPVDPG
jgi:ribosome-associated protein